MNRLNFKSPLTAIILTTVSLSAFAQSAAPASAESSMTVGAAFLIAPEYLGAKKSTFQVAPVISYRNNNGFFAGIREGVGFGAKVDQYSFSAALAYRPGRQDSSSRGLSRGSDDLRGLGDIENSFIARLSAGYTFDGGVNVKLDSNLALNQRETGNTFGLGLKLPVFSSQTDQIAVDLSTSYGDRKYNQSNFGVTNTQSANSGYKAFNAKAGFNQVSATVGWNHVIDKNWSIATRAGLTQVTGNAADSPIVKKKTNGILMTSINYTF
jgi:MipA family protein